MRIRTLTALIALSFLIGCQARHSSSSSTTTQTDATFTDDQKFAKILEYYRTTFPGASFADGRMVHFSDGTNSERLHITVPAAVDAEFQHAYAPEFLATQSKSADGRARMVAGELLLLRNERLFSYPSRAGYGEGSMVKCITYVVKVGPRK